MNTRTSLLLAFAVSPFLVGIAQAAQKVDISNITRNGITQTGPVFVSAGDSVRFDALLVTNGGANPPGTTGLGLCLEYNRAAAGDPSFNNVLGKDFLADGSPTPLGPSDCDAGSSAPVPGANYMVIKGWAALSGGWPNMALPVKLYDAQFTLPATPNGFTLVGFGASTVGSAPFLANGPLALCGKPSITLTTTANGSETGTPISIDVTLSSAIPAVCGTNGVFPVLLTLSGTATAPGQANADYVISGTGISSTGGTLVTATFPADGSTTNLTVRATPIGDSQVEASETLTVTVASGSGNYAGVGAVASANLADGTSVPAVVEYLNTLDFPGSPGGHFFYSSDPAEQAAVDAGAAGRFNRTGRQFLTGGTTPVCRFYGSINPGPNSHFFTVEETECDALQDAQVTPTPTDVQQWNYERIEYFSTPVVIGQNGVRSCPPNRVPVYRAYNNAFPLTGPRNPWDSNHRFTPVQADIDAMVAQGWRDEGFAFCTTP